MEIVPWRPFGDLSRLRREMDDLWTRFFGGTALPRVFGEGWIPSVDISETDKDVLVNAELPGLETKDVNVSISGDVLTIKGEKKKEEEKKDEHYHSRERYAGSFQRTFRLPVNVKSDKATASFKDGILTVVIPKAEEAKKRQIEIKTN